MTGRRLRWALLALVSAAASVVVWKVFNPIPHSGGDNAGYIALAHGLLKNGTYTDVFDPAGLPHTKYPPVFPALLAAMMAFGARTWAALKLSAAIPTVLAVAFTYLWAERRLGAVGGFAVAILLAVSSGIVYYSQWILSDPLFLALTVGALWTLERADPEGPDAGGAQAALWLAGGVALTGLAYFTRSAGLPLVLALLVTLGLRRSWRSLLLAGGALGLPMLLWTLRGRGEGVAQYGTEFWMVDPYQPDMGAIGPLGLVPRIFDNLGAYVLSHVPTGIVGSDGRGLAAIGVVLTGAAVIGWGLRVRKRIGVAEVFFPLYAALILVWPAIWGGDRFALPLYPLLFVYTAEAIEALVGHVPTLALHALAAVGLLALLLPAGGHWLRQSRQIRACAQVSARTGPWGCYGPRIGSFVEAARWSGSGLPPGAAVLSRKPRHFYLLSGHPSRAFPFSDDPAALLALADELGARYVLLDRWDGLAGRYVGGAVQRWPAAFCFAAGFGSAAESGAQLLGILPPGARGAPGDGQVAGISRCPTEYYAPGVQAPTEAGGYSSSRTIPLLEDLDP